MIVYVINAYRFGDREAHSYLEAVLHDKEMAFKHAEYHENYRGGKYECEIIEYNMDTLSQVIIKHIGKN